MTWRQASWRLFSRADCHRFWSKHYENGTWSCSPTSSMPWLTKRLKDSLPFTGSLSSHRAGRIMWHEFHAEHKPCCCITYDLSGKSLCTSEALSKHAENAYPSRRLPGWEIGFHLALLRLQVTKTSLGIFSKCPPKARWHIKRIGCNHFICHFYCHVPYFPTQFYPRWHDAQEEAG